MDKTRKYELRFPIGNGVQKVKSGIKFFKRCNLLSLIETELFSLHFLLVNKNSKPKLTPKPYEQVPNINL